MSLDIRMAKLEEKVKGAMDSVINNDSVDVEMKKPIKRVIPKDKPLKTLPSKDKPLKRPIKKEMLKQPKMRKPYMPSMKDGFPYDIMAGENLA